LSTALLLKSLVFCPRSIPIRRPESFRTYSLCQGAWLCAPTFSYRRCYLFVTGFPSGAGGIISPIAKLVNPSFDFFTEQAYFPTPLRGKSFENSLPRRVFSFSCSVLSHVSQDSLFFWKYIPPANDL
jgi:hypothetical protein